MGNWYCVIGADRFPSSGPSGVLEFLGVESFGFTNMLISLHCFLLLAVPVWLKKPEDSQLEEGKPGYLHCLTQATPKPTVVWYRNQMLISEVRVRVAAGRGQDPLPLLPAVLTSTVLFPKAAPRAMLVGVHAETSCGHILCAAGLTV